MSIVQRFGCVFAVCLTMTAMGRVVSANPANPDPLGGWQILAEDFDTSSYLDIIAYEWDYYMIHDARSGFYGIIGYLISNPRGRLSDLVQVLPDGGNIAIVGRREGEKPVAQYINFGLDNYQASSEERFFDAQLPDGTDFGRQTPLRGGAFDGSDAMRIEGRCSLYSWDLVISQDWADRNTDEVRPTVGTDIGHLPEEIWTVDVIWPRTVVRGTITDLSTGETIDIDGHGYRENSWGRYLLTPDGWDFYVFSEDRDDLAAAGIPEDEGVSMVVQTYHKSELLDFTDISFYDDGELKNLRFEAAQGEMSWWHPHWQWDNESWQCVPLDAQFDLEDEDYRIEVDVTIGLENERPILSDITLPVARYFIQELFPHYEGRIVNKHTGRLVREFSGHGGGEFSFYKSARLWPAPTPLCNWWGWSKFSH